MSLLIEVVPGHLIADIVKIKTLVFVSLAEECLMLVTGDGQQVRSSSFCNGFVTELYVVFQFSVQVVVHL